MAANYNTHVFALLSVWSSSNLLSAGKSPGWFCSCEGVAQGCDFTKVYCSPVDNNCNKVNVALGKRANLSSLIHYQIANYFHTELLGCLGVNGNTNTTLQYATWDSINANCIHTGFGDDAPSYIIDLRLNYTVTDLTFFLRKSYEYHMRSVNVNVDYQRCHSFPKDFSSNVQEHHVVCTRPLRGRYIQIAKPSWSKHLGYALVEHILNICEVQVWVCKSGFYGKNCTDKCNCKAHCDNYFGTCSKEGCTDGFWGAMCQYSCFRCAENVCVDNGTCKYGCQKGFTGFNCSKEQEEDGEVAQGSVDISLDENNLIPVLGIMFGAVTLIAASSGLILIFQKKNGSQSVTSDTEEKPMEVLEELQKKWSSESPVSSVYLDTEEFSLSRLPNTERSPPSESGTVDSDPIRKDGEEIDEDSIDDDSYSQSSEGSARKKLEEQESQKKRNVERGNIKENTEEIVNLKENEKGLYNLKESKEKRVNLKDNEKKKKHKN